MPPKIPDSDIKAKHPVISFVSSWDEKYGKFFAWLWRLIFYPLLALGIYAGNSYLNEKYVSKPYFDKAMTTLSEDKAKYNAEHKAGLSEISAKLDSLLLRDSANGQRFNDYERRIGRMEDKIDRLQGK